MPLILSIETATSICSVALHDNEKLIAVSEVHQAYSHASKLGILVDDVINLAGIKVIDIHAVAISSGPGSYTGLRIGVSLAKGLCYALNIPLIAVSTLQVLASSVSAINTADVFLCPMIDARRMEVYCQVLDINLAEKEPIEAMIINGESFAEYLNMKPVIFFGSGAAKCREVIVHENAKFLSDIVPSANRLGERAYKKLLRGDVEDLFHFVPHYLKEFYIKKASQV